MFFSQGVAFHGMMVPSDQSRKCPEISSEKARQPTNQEGLVKAC